MELTGKTALVLGAVKGIGKAVALALMKSGAAVAVNYFDWEEELETLKSELAAAGRNHLVLKTDLRQVEGIPAMVQTAVERFGRLDILINNIERGGWPVVHGPYVRAQWDLELETCLRAKHWVFAAALPFLKASGDGAVINFSSIAGVVGRAGAAAPVFNDGYAAASRALSSLTETWAREGAPEVRVNEIMLGFVETRHGPGTRGWTLLNAAQKRAIRDHTLLGRIGTVADVVKTVMFLLRDAPFMTGSILRLDGGYVLGGEKMQPIPKGVEG
jgi:3-oxoacyl-[acyl-carrier protein] reductase